MALSHAAACACAPVTFTTTAQLAPAPSVPLASETTFDATLTVPPHPGALPFAAVMPAGSISLNAMPDSALPPFGLLIVIVRTEPCPTTIDVGEKPSAMFGGATGTPVDVVSVALLLPATGSVNPAGALTVAVLVSVPLADGETVP